ncbi:hypothetical protein DBV10_05670 [Acidovorax sp. FJL06]|nr:hypothetical protein DBV10_05670 [Acidovorax sp. FJL06]
MLIKKQKLFIAAVGAVLLHFLFFSYSFEDLNFSEPLHLLSLGSVHMFYAEAPLYLFRGAFIPQLMGLVVLLLVLIVLGFVLYNDRYAATRS